jgi:CheY-like chemotaxis protein
MNKILVVDDDSSVLAVMKFTLIRAGFNVLTTNKPHEAIPLIRVEQPNLIISDYKMPSLTGLDLLQQLRALSEPEIALTPLILMSAAISPSLFKALETIERVDFIEKPFVSQQLIQKVEYVLSQFQD